MANTPSMPVKQATLTTGEAITAVGQMIAVDTSAATAFAATASATRTVVGVNSEAAAISTSIGVVGGIWRFDNLTSTDITQADIGKLAYVSDSTTVTRESTVAIAGTVIDVDTNGVWIDVGVNTATQS